MGKKKDEVERARDAFAFARLEIRMDSVPGVILRKGEVAFLHITGVQLVEPRRAPSQWVGGSQGVSFRIAKGVRIHSGSTRGRVIQGAERPTAIDIGHGIITNQRIMFLGGKRTTEWDYTKLLGVSLEFETMAIFNVSNRQKSSGFGYPKQLDNRIDAVVLAAIAAFKSPEEHAAVVADYRAAYELTLPKRKRLTELH